MHTKITREQLDELLAKKARAVKIDVDAANGGSSLIWAKAREAEEDVELAIEALDWKE